MLLHIRHAARSLRRAPAFTAAVVASLALGIGATITVFLVINGVLLRPLPYPEAERLVAVFLREPQNPNPRNPTSPRELRRWQEATTLEEMTAATPWSPTLTGDGRPDRLRGLRTSVSLFRMLGAEALLGRTFAPGDADPGAPRVVVLGHALWQRRFDSDPAIVGRTLRLDGEPATVAGVMAPRFRFPPFWEVKAELWTPLRLAPEDWERDARFLRVFARRKSGASLDQAQSEMDVIARRVAAEDPENNAGTGILVEPLREPVVHRIRPALLLLAGAAALVLLLACANVANLQLARALDRRREDAVRLALGAGRRHLTAGALAESGLLAAAGGAAGLLAATWTVSALPALAPEVLPAVADLRLDARVAGFSVGVSALAALLFGLAPVGRALRRNTASALADSGRHSGSAERGLARRALAVAEIAMATMLLAGAGLLLRSVWSLETLDPGFGREHVLTAQVSLAGSPFAAPERQQAFHRDLQERLAALPAVEAAGAANFLPVGGDLWGMRFVVEGAPEADPERFPRASFRVITPGYLAAMSTPLERGRDFTWSDDEASQPVVIINRTLAASYWPGEDPVGKRLRWAVGDPDDTWMMVVGVATDARQWDLADDVRPEVYFPYGQNPVPRYDRFALALRTAEGTKPAPREVLEAVWSIDPDLPVSDLRTMESILDDSLLDRSFRGALVAGFAGLGLLLAGVGVYGVLAYGVARRTREFGIRMALGAHPRAVIRLVVGQGLLLACVGIGAGIAGALALGGLLESFLFGVTSRDPATYLVSALALAVVGVLACAVPARRASRVDPLVSLHHE